MAANKTLVYSTIINWNKNCIGDSIQCNQIITVFVETDKEKQSIYNICYVWELTSEDNHPFYKDQSFLVSHNDGELISKNPLTDKLVEFLVMDNEALRQYSGRESPECYRRNIIKAITHFWE